eukprot:TRINITY_DN24111_c0_g1_i1.p1 TRINITY_DN24111_c0_g1~~TRINITY_DN24111_c0_g1_i1.p1  ORF type:complete len:296 (-),score=42.01 TRINITY_DN24111_c0_g1_i1:33-881(-)
MIEIHKLHLLDENTQITLRYLLSLPSAYTTQPQPWLHLKMIEIHKLHLLDENTQITLRYLLSLPSAYTTQPQARWPLLLFLHGSGERSGDMDVLNKHGIPRLLQVYQRWKTGGGEGDAGSGCARFVVENFITVSPQLDPSHPFGWKPTLLGALLDTLEQTYRVDPGRIYATGLAMGGFGVFNLAQHFPGRLAAIIPICGGGDASNLIPLRQLPTWVFHGELDEVIPVAYSKEMVDELDKMGSNVKFTFYPEADHNQSWTVTYNNMDIYNWLLEQRRISEPNK